MAKKRPISASTRELRAALVPKDPTRSVNPITGAVTKLLPPIARIGEPDSRANADEPAVRTGDCLPPGFVASDPRTRPDGD